MGREGEDAWGVVVSFVSSEVGDSALEGGDSRKDKDDKPVRLRPRGVAGTTVCVDVVETDDEEDADGAGECERDGGCESYEGGMGDDSGLNDLRGTNVWL